jgi:hypothetical protein
MLQRLMQSPRQMNRGFMLTFVVLSVLAGCRTGAQVMTTSPVPMKGNPMLPPQLVRGLEMTGHFRSSAVWATADSPSRPVESHVLDLRLTNRHSSPKRNVRIESSRLGRFAGRFSPTHPQTLWTRGSSCEFPSVAGWNITDPSPPPQRDSGRFRLAQTLGIHGAVDKTELKFPQLARMVNSFLVKK